MTNNEKIHFAKFALQFDSKEKNQGPFNPLESNSDALVLFLSLGMEMGEYVEDDAQRLDNTLSAGNRWYYPDVDVNYYLRVGQFAGNTTVFRDAVTEVAAKIGKHLAINFPKEYAEYTQQ